MIGVLEVGDVAEDQTNGVASAFLATMLCSTFLKGILMARSTQASRGRTAQYHILTQLES